MAGAPVFTGFNGGAGKILGPTGGYIIGYVLLAFIEGVFVDWARKLRPYEEAGATAFFGMLLGTIVLYVFGSLWLAKQSNMSLAAAFTVGVFPFIIGDVIKMVVALFVGTRIRRALVKSNLI